MEDSASAWRSGTSAPLQINFTLTIPMAPKTPDLVELGEGLRSDCVLDSNVVTLGQERALLPVKLILNSLDHIAREESRCHSIKPTAYVAGLSSASNHPPHYQSSLPLTITPHTHAGLKKVNQPSSYLPQCSSRSPRSSSPSRQCPLFRVVRSSPCPLDSPDVLVQMFNFLVTPPTPRFHSVQQGTNVPPVAPLQKRVNCGNGDFDLCCDFDTGCRSASTCLLECSTGEIGGDLGCIAGESTRAHALE